MARLRLQYDEANKEVAILCNHQKGVNKNHEASMAKLADKKTELESELGGATEAAAAKIRFGSSVTYFETQALTRCFTQRATFEAERRDGFEGVS